MPDDSPVAADSSGYPRLESQITWYDMRSVTAQRNFKLLKLCQIVVAAMIPVAALVQPNNTLVPGILGAVILVLEGIQELGMYRQNWQKYRSNCEALRHEKYLFLAGAGPFVDLEDDERRRLLAERVEHLISQEHSNWVAQFKDNASASATSK